MIANMGYVGFAADIYGAEFEGGVTDKDIRLEQYKKYIFEDPALFVARINAAVRQVKSMPEVDTENIALIGYCFGGSGVIMFSLDDGALNNDVKAVASFHGGLGPHIWNHRNITMREAKDDEHPSVLVLSGGSDDQATDIAMLEDTFDSASLTWEITRFSNVEHAFTVWTDDRYNPWVDTRSWASMKQFFKKQFGETSFAYDVPTDIDIEAVSYTDDADGKKLQGYLAKPDSSKWMTPAPLVVIIP